MLSHLDAGSQGRLRRLADDLVHLPKVRRYVRWYGPEMKWTIAFDAEDCKLGFIGPRYGAPLFVAAASEKFVKLMDPKAIRKPVADALVNGKKAGHSAWMELPIRDAADVNAIVKFAEEKNRLLMEATV